MPTTTRGGKTSGRCSVSMIERKDEKKNSRKRANSTTAPSTSETSPEKLTKMFDSRIALPKLSPITHRATVVWWRFFSPLLMKFVQKWINIFYYIQPILHYLAGWQGDFNDFTQQFEVCQLQGLNRRECDCLVYSWTLWYANFIEFAQRQSNTSVHSQVGGEGSCGKRIEQPHDDQGSGMLHSWWEINFLFRNNRVSRQRRLLGATIDGQEKFD